MHVKLFFNKLAIKLNIFYFSVKYYKKLKNAYIKVKKIVNKLNKIY